LASLSGRFVALAALLIAAAAGAAYADSFSGPWVFDDLEAIARNVSLHHFLTALFPPGGGLPVSGRPVLNLSFALDYVLCGTQVAGRLLRACDRLALGRAPARHRSGDLPFAAG
jgi:hypothetical protein